MHMRKILVLLAAIAVFAQTVNCWTYSAKTRPDLDAKFLPQSIGWLGGDVATSVRLFGDLYLWIWGDTYVGNLEIVEGRARRANCLMPHSSLAFANASQASPEPVVFFLNKNATTYTDVFVPQQPAVPDQYYWLINAMVLPQSKWLVFLAMDIHEIKTPPGFEGVGTDLVYVQQWQNIQPDKWKYITVKIPSSSEKLGWNEAWTFNTADNFIYIMGDATIQGQHVLVLSRINEGQLVSQRFEQFQYWTGSLWSYNINAMGPLFKPIIPISETTLMWHPYMQEWYIVMNQIMTMKIYIAHAKNITGPWVEDAVWEIPPQPFSYWNYGGKAHPEYQTTPNSIVFSYNTNTAPDDTERFKVDLMMYHPHFVEVTITP